jgi:hypothetical protein
MILNTKLFCTQTPALVPCMLKLLFYLHYLTIYLGPFVTLIEDLNKKLVFGVAKTLATK